MYLSVRDFLELYTDSCVEIELYSLEDDKTIYKGYSNDIDDFDGLEDLEVISIDPPFKDKQVINV